MCCSDGKACDLSVSPGGSSPTESSFHSFTILSKLRIATLATPSVCRSHTQLPVVTSLNKTLERCSQIPTVTKIGQHMVPKRKIHFKHFYWPPEDFRPCFPCIFICVSPENTFFSWKEQSFTFIGTIYIYRVASKKMDIGISSWPSSKSNCTFPRRF